MKDCPEVIRKEAVFTNVPCGQQCINMLEEKLTPSITEIDGKEECPTVHVAAPISHHLELLPRNTLRSFRVTLAES